MPVITVQMHKTSQEQKTALIRDLTAAASAATQVPVTSFTVLIQELESGNIGLAGKTLTEVLASR